MTFTAFLSVKVTWPSLRVAIFDAAFAAERCRVWSHLHGMSHQIAARDPAVKGFVVVARRWIAERSFGWLSYWNGLVRDRAGRLDVSAGRYAFAAAASSVEAILNPVPLQNEAA